MKNSNYPGKFVVIEGLDGSGQSTQASLLRDFFVEKGYQVVLTKEPTKDSEAGRKIKRILTEKIEIDPFEFQKLYSQDRREHLERVITPALKKRKIVISDRYFFSSFAYGTAQGANLDEIIKLNDEFLYPDLTFLLKVKPEVCIERIEKRGDSKTLFEKTEKLAKVWQVYEKFPVTFENIKIIDGEQSIKEVFKDIVLNLMS